MSFLRRRAVPQVVLALPLEPGERRLAWGLTAAGEPVVATDQTLHLPGGAALPWTQVERVSWRAPVLEVLEVALVEGTGRRWTLQIADESRLTEVIRSQVTASVGWSNHVRLQPAGGVRIVGRRRPGRDDLDWQVVFDPDTDPHDPALRAQAEGAVADARRTLG